MNDEIKIFSNPQFGDVRVIKQNNEPWFVGKDVANVLGYTNPRKAIIDHVDDEDKGVTFCDTLGGTQQTTIINESGLYSLILSSKLPQAKEFKRWVTSEVLPSIRKQGGYMVAREGETEDELIARALIIAKNALDKANKRNAELEEDNSRLNSLNAENEKIIDAQGNKIKLLTPKAKYTDMVLQSKELLTVTQIAQDFGMSAKRLNKILAEIGIQHKVNGQWILYGKYLGHGYTQSVAHDIELKDGSHKTVNVTYWTRQGQKLIYFMMKGQGYNITSELNFEDDNIWQ